MKPWEHFRLVLGYLPCIDRVPVAAAKLGLQRRVALVLNDDDVPHSQVYWDLVEAFLESLVPDSVIFEIDSANGPLAFASVSLMREHVEGRKPEFGGPFNRARFFQRGKANAFIDVEPWAAVGGPSPYSDSWTFAVYRDTDDVTLLRNACYRVCQQHGWPVLEEIRGRDTPVEPSWWRRLVQWFLR